MKTILSAIIALCCLCSQSIAGGSVDLGQITKVLKTDPGLWKHLDSTLNFDAGGSATRLGRHWPHLGGARIGPYVIRVTSKSADKTPFELTVHCEQVFYDKDGKVLPMKNGEVTDEIIKNTVRVGEKVISVSLAPWKEEAEE
ncbi:hypothetical protein NT6N_07850 [Oceaniferula spumae]|uniref:Uncharacterized protein n=1 Tax=Oceaniferula spumae TaxID=2979115 RepID=A0AAT9FII1_9BACT